LIIIIVLMQTLANLFTFMMHTALAKATQRKLYVSSPTNSPRLTR